MIQNRWLLTIIVCSKIAVAGLGRSEESIQTDRKKTRSTESVLKTERFTLHVLNDVGRTVNEYVLPSGTVFAVSWRGVSTPDLYLLLGPYFDEYLDATAKSKTNRRGGPKTIQTEHLWVQKSGHMRDVKGKVLIKGLTPPGMTVAEIR